MMKTMLITGVSWGIGAATALLAAQSGYKVVVNYTKNETAADQVIRSIQRPGGTAVANQADSTNIIPLQCGGTAEGVTEAINCVTGFAGLWLASDKSAYSTSTFIDVTGGK